MFGKLGVPELVLILAVALIIFGPRKLPEIGRSIGRGIREFRQATTEVKKSVSFDEDLEEVASEELEEKSGKNESVELKELASKAGNKNSEPADQKNHDLAGEEQGVTRHAG